MREASWPLTQTAHQAGGEGVGVQLGAAALEEGIAFGEQLERAVEGPGARHALLDGNMEGGIVGK
jgi:hypothetical protein